MKQRNTHWANGFESFVNFLCPTRSQSCRFQIYYPIMVFMSWNTNVMAHAAIHFNASKSIYGTSYPGVCWVRYHLSLKKWENNQVQRTSLPQGLQVYESQSHQSQVGHLSCSKRIPWFWRFVVLLCDGHIAMFMYLYVMFELECFFCSMYVCMCNHARYSIMLSL